MRTAHPYASEVRNFAQPLQRLPDSARLDPRGPELVNAPELLIRSAGQWNAVRHVFQFPKDTERQLWLAVTEVWRSRSLGL